MTDIPRVKWVEADPDDEDSRGYIADTDGDFEVMPWELVANYNRLADEVSRPTRERDEARAELDAVGEERTRLANDLGDLTLLHSVVSENEDDLRAVGHRIAGLFNRDPEDHQVAGVLQDIAEELIAWRADPSQVPDGWRSLVRKGWNPGRAENAADAKARYWERVAREWASMIEQRTAERNALSRMLRDMARRVGDQRRIVAAYKQGLRDALAVYYKVAGYPKAGDGHLWTLEEVAAEFGVDLNESTADGTVCSACQKGYCDKCDGCSGCPNGGGGR